MYIVLIGAPGAGKGTQSVALTREFGLPHIASGDMFREAMGRGTLWGLQAKQYVERGELVPDEVTTSMVMERLAHEDAARGAILDGYPRNVSQARSLDAALRAEGKRVDEALYLSVPGDELLRRLSGRWLCRQCQTPYHTVFSPPQVAGRCDRCGGELYQRPDDNIETARRRLEVFEETKPVIDYYRQAGVLDEVDGTRTIPEVEQALAAAVRRRAGI